jgi:hypothetical protein
MKHIMMLVLMGNKLHFAPIAAKPSQIIDLGTGTGTWAVESMSSTAKSPNSPANEPLSSGREISKRNCDWH